MFSEAFQKMRFIVSLQAQHQEKDSADQMQVSILQTPPSELVV